LRYLGKKLRDGILKIRFSTEPLFGKITYPHPFPKEGYPLLPHFVFPYPVPVIPGELMPETSAAIP
jgi:hypothetical protein